jgi:hypothetical protein
MNAYETMVETVRRTDPKELKQKTLELEQKLIDSHVFNWQYHDSLVGWLDLYEITPEPERIVHDVASSILALMYAFSKIEDSVELS